MATATPAVPPSLESLLPPDDDDKTSIVWSDPSWPFGDLTRSSALRYFELSPFYEPADCNNADARARGLDPSVEGVLRSFPPGRTEYVVAEAHEAQRLFVIRRQVRRLPGAPGAGGGGGGSIGGPAGGVARATGYFYILYMSVYQAPTLHAALSARLDRALHLVRGALGATERALAPLPRLLREERAAERGAAAARQRRATGKRRRRGQEDGEDAAMTEEGGPGGGGAKLLKPLPPAVATRGGEAEAATAAAGGGTAGRGSGGGGDDGGGGTATTTTTTTTTTNNTAEARAAAPLPVSRPPVPAAEQRVWERGDALVMRALGRYGDARRWQPPPAPAPAPPRVGEQQPRAQRKQQQARGASGGGKR
jgi:mediator of RNA polymerase II transcription subunit 6